MPSQTEQEMNIATISDGNDTVKAGDLRNYIKRIENRLKDKQDVLDDIKAIKAEAKGQGFDVPTINKILQIRSKDARKVEEEEILLSLYKRALGMDE